MSSSSSSSDEEEDLAAMMRFAGHKQTKPSLKTKRIPNMEDETITATRALQQQHRAKEKAERLSKEQSALRALTLKNMEAFESTVNAENDVENFETVNVKSLEGIDFNDHMKLGQKLLADKNYEKAIETFKESCTIVKGKTPEMIESYLALGQAELKADNVREAIRYLSFGLGLCKKTKGHDSNAIKYLTHLIAACGDIGKSSEVEAYTLELQRLRGNASKPKSTESAPKPKPIPQSLKGSMDQAIEASLRGQFGLLRAILVAFRKPRGDVNLVDVVSYQHSQTGASALMVASAKGELKVVEALLMAGAPLDRRAADGSTALSWACKFNQPAVARKLLDAGALFDGNMDAAMIMSWSSDIQKVVREFISTRKAQPPPPPSKDTKEKEKELEAWKDDDGETGTKQTSLDDEKHDANWDQFQANRALGVKDTTFDENLYTTALNVEQIPKEVREKAEALSREMENEKKSKPAVKSEDEEAAYSAVLRDSSAVTDDDGFTDASVLRKKNNRKPNKNNNKR